MKYTKNNKTVRNMAKDELKKTPETSAISIIEEQSAQYI